MTAIKNIKLIAEQASKGASLTEKSNSSKSNKTKNKLVRNVPNRLKEEHKELYDNGYTELSFSKFMIEATRKHLKSFNKKLNRQWVYLTELKSINHQKMRPLRSFF